MKITPEHKKYVINMIFLFGEGKRTVATPLNGDLTWNKKYRMYKVSRLCLLVLQ